MPHDDKPSEVNQSQVAAQNLTAGRDIQIGQILQLIVNLGLPFNSQHLRFAQFVANTVYASLLLGGFLRLGQHGADEKTLLMLILGCGLLSLTCVYYGWFWKPDKSVKRRQIKQRLEIVGCFAIPLLTWSGFFIWQAFPPSKVLVLVANFANAQNADYRDDRRVTENILKNLQDATKP